MIDQKVMCHDKAEILKRNNVNISGNGDKTVLLAHGFGCDQNMWRFMLPALEKQFKVVLFDYVGSGKSDLNSFSKKDTQALMVMRKI